MNAVFRKPRTLNDLLTGITAKAQRVSVATRSWPAFLPRTANLDEVTAALDALQSDIRELRQSLEDASGR